MFGSADDPGMAPQQHIIVVRDTFQQIRLCARNENAVRSLKLFEVGFTAAEVKAARRRDKFKQE